MVHIKLYNSTYANFDTPVSIIIFNRVNMSPIGYCIDFNTSYIKKFVHIWMGLGLNQYMFANADNTLDQITITRFPKSTVSSLVV